MGIRNSASVYTYVRSTSFVSDASSAPGGKARVQYGASVVNTDAVLELIAHRELENWASISQFHQGRLATAPRLVEFV